MDLLKSSNRRSKLSHSIYILLNIGLAIGLLAIALTIDTPWVAVALVTLSKWRVFAVRVRFWSANILANAVDYIVSLGFVTYLYTASGVLWLQILLTILYIGWLLFIKPRSKRQYISIQAGVAVYVGTSAVLMLGHLSDSILVVAAMWVIGFSAARHILINYDEPHTNLLAFIWGLVFAELGWLGFHWTFGYSLPGFGDIKLVQLSIIMTMMSFVIERGYVSKYNNGQIRTSDILLPVLLTVSTTLILLIFFNSISGLSGLE